MNDDTGMPKGLVHTTAGYALYAAFTTATTFNLNDGDMFACVLCLVLIYSHGVRPQTWPIRQLYIGPIT